MEFLIKIDKFNSLEFNFLVFAILVLHILNFYAGFLTRQTDFNFKFHYPSMLSFWQDLNNFYLILFGTYTI